MYVRKNQALLLSLCGLGGRFSCVHGLGELATMTRERSRWREFTELVPNHVFNDEHVFELVSRVDGEGEPHHLWRDRRCSRPRFDHGLGVRTKLLNLCGQFLVDERSFLQTA